MEIVQRPTGRLVNFRRVIDVQYHHNLYRRIADPLQQRITHSLRYYDGKACVQAYAANVRNAADSRCPLGQQLVVGCQRVAAAENDFIDFRGCSKGIKQPLPVGRAEALLVVGEVTAKTVATVNRTLAGYHQQGPAAVLPDQAHGLNGSVFLKWIGNKALSGAGLEI